MDFSTLTVHLFGSTVTGRSNNPHKELNHKLHNNSDIDLFVSVYKINGTPWERSAGPSKAFEYKGVHVEVISKFDPGGLDTDLLFMGIEINMPPSEQELPMNATLLREPK